MEKSVCGCVVWVVLVFGVGVGGGCGVVEVMEVENLKISNVHWAIIAN